MVLMVEYFLSYMYIYDCRDEQFFKSLNSRYKSGLKYKKTILQLVTVMIKYNRNRLELRIDF